MSISGRDDINQGDDLHLTCIVRGVPIPTVSWQLDGISLIATTDGQVSFPTPNSLYIKVVSGAYTGRYGCLVVNGAGKTSKYIDVSIQGRFVLLDRDRIILRLNW